MSDEGATIAAVNGNGRKYTNGIASKAVRSVSSGVAHIQLVASLTRLQDHCSEVVHDLENMGSQQKTEGTHALLGKTQHLVFLSREYEKTGDAEHLQGLAQAAEDFSHFMKYDMTKAGNGAALASANPVNRLLQDFQEKYEAHQAAMEDSVVIHTPGTNGSSTNGNGHATGLNGNGRR